MKKYSTRKMIFHRIYDLSDCNELVDDKPIKAIVNQALINKVFRAKKRFKNKYDSKAKKFYIFKGKNLSNCLFKKYSKAELEETRKK